MKRQTGKIGSNSDYSERYTDDNICMQKDGKNADGSAKKRTITENKKKKKPTHRQTHIRADKETNERMTGQIQRQIDGQGNTGN